MRRASWVLRGTLVTMALSAGSATVVWAQSQSALGGRCNAKKFGKAPCAAYETARSAWGSGNLPLTRDTILNHRELNQVAVAQVLLGHVSEDLKDWPHAEMGYRRFLQLTKGAVQSNGVLSGQAVMLW